MAKNVLLVDDSSTMRKIVSRSLRQAGPDFGEIFEAAEGLEALDVLEKESVDIVLSDINMPNMNGIEAMIKIKELEKEIKPVTPVIALTANAVSGDKQKYLDNGFDDYLAKPINMNELLLSLKKYFR